MATETPDRPLYTVADAATRLRLSRSKVYQLAAAGLLPAVRLGKSVRIRADRLDAWLDRQSTERER